MKDFVDITMSFQTVILCVTAFMVVTIGRIIGSRLHKSGNKKVQMVVTWVGTMWLPLWPLIIGALLTMTPGMPLHPKLAEYGAFPKMMFGAFCGMISTGVIAQVHHMLSKLGVDVNIPGIMAKKNKPESTPAGPSVSSVSEPPPGASG
jgi:hypothetical protein